MLPGNESQRNINTNVDLNKSRSALTHENRKEVGNQSVGLQHTDKTRCSFFQIVNDHLENVLLKSVDENYSEIIEDSSDKPNPQESDYNSDKSYFQIINDNDKEFIQIINDSNYKDCIQTIDESNDKKYFQVNSDSNDTKYFQVVDDGCDKNNIKVISDGNDTEYAQVFDDYSDKEYLQAVNDNSALQQSTTQCSNNQLSTAEECCVFKGAKFLTTHQICLAVIMLYIY